ncbi:MAG: hypothetical protein DSY42_07850 [Aquifex sp.]|nr:MAG: hypothetical protein DSY42_07850 [Aquifex sp.]
MILETLYVEAELEIPNWTKEEEEDFEEEEDIEETIRAFFLNLINEAYTKHIGKIHVETEKYGEEKITTIRESVEDRVLEVLEANVIPGIKLMGENIIITKVIIDKLEKEVVGLGGLRGLADLLNWQYKPKYSWRENGKTQNKSVVLVKLDNFLEFLTQ